MMTLMRTTRFLLLAASVALLSGPGFLASAQSLPVNQSVIQEIEARGFSNISGLTRRGENLVFQALDPFGMKVRVVMNAKTGEIVGLSRFEPNK